MTRQLFFSCGSQTCFRHDSFAALFYILSMMVVEANPRPVVYFFLSQPLVVLSSYWFQLFEGTFDQGRKLDLQLLALNNTCGQRIHLSCISGSR